MLLTTSTMLRGRGPFNDVELAMSPDQTMEMSTTTDKGAALTTTNDGTLNDQR